MNLQYIKMRERVKDLQDLGAWSKFSSNTHLGNGQVNLIVSTSLCEMDGVISPGLLY